MHLCISQVTVFLAAIDSQKLKSKEAAESGQEGAFHQQSDQYVKNQIARG